jgi:hypothetical protein
VLGWGGTVETEERKSWKCERKRVKRKESEKDSRKMYCKKVKYWQKGCKFNPLN